MTFDYLINEAVVQAEKIRQEAQHAGRIQKAYGIEIATKIFMDLAANQREKNLVLKKEDVFKMQDEIARREQQVKDMRCCGNCKNYSYSTEKHICKKNFGCFFECDVDEDWEMA